MGLEGAFPAGSAARAAPAPADSPAALDRSVSTARAWAARHAEALTATAVVLVALMHLLRVYNRGFNLLDEGFVLHVAERVLQGQVPYRDFFTQLTPGAFLALAAVFAVTGPSALVGRWITVLLGLLITFLLFHFARRLVSRPVAAFAALAFPVWGIAQGWFYPNYSWFALAAATGALGAALRACARAEHDEDQSAPLAWRRLGWASAAGLGCGLAAFCKQNIGLYTLVALVCAILVAGPGGWRRRALAAAGMTAASLPVPLALLAWLWAQGALASFYRDAVWIPLAVFPREMAAPYPAFWPPWPVPADPPGQGAWAFRLVCLLPPLPFGGGALWLLGSALRTARRRGAPAGDPARRGAFACWLAFGLAIWATAFPRADFDHVQVSLGPIFILGAAILEELGRFLVRRRVWRLWAIYRLLSTIDGAWCRRWLPQVLACSVLCGFLVTGLGNARALRMGSAWSLRTLDAVAPRASGILLDHEEAAELIRLLAQVQRLSKPGDAIASLPWNAGLYFLAERRNATRFDLYLPASILPDDLPEIETSLDRATLVVYWTARDAFIDNSSLDDRLPELHQYVMSRYRAVAAVNAYRLLVP